MLRDRLLGDPNKSGRDGKFLDDALKGTRRYRLDVASVWLTRIAIVIGLVTFTSFHTITLFGAPWTEEPLLFVLVAIAPAVLTTVLIPGQWRHPMRWIVLFTAILVTLPQYAALVMITVETWALYRSWVIEGGWRSFGRRIGSIIARIRHGAGSNVEGA